MSIVFIILALLNGFMIVTTRVVNAKLGLYISGTGAAVWNHLVGFIFLSLWVPFLTNGTSFDLKGIPFYLFLGGFIGAGYVAINNWLIPNVGATKATVLVIAGQIVFGTIIDAANGNISNLNLTVIGITLVVLGMWVGNYKKMITINVQKPQNKLSEDCA